ncbi:MAG: CBS domain-containing protein [Myxococcales bacterium]|nr:CBS domain-containing protein [Myxococcales bacterium]
MNLEARLLGTFATAHPVQVARTLESMPTSDAAEVMAELPVEVLAELLRWVAPLTAARCLEAVPAEVATLTLSAARSDVAAAILRTTNQARRSKVIESLSPVHRKAMRSLLRYPEGTAGALMDPGVIALTESVSAGEALEQLRISAQHALYYVYVVSDDLKLTGVVNIRELMGARPDQLLGLISTRTVDSLSARASWESIVAHPAWKRVHALPVVESDGRFLGAVRYESLRELEDRLAGAELEDHGAQTGAALSELYGLGLRGLLDWAASALSGSATSDRGRS